MLENQRFGLSQDRWPTERRRPNRLASVCIVWQSQRLTGDSLVEPLRQLLRKENTHMLRFFIATFLTLCFVASSFGREWSDATGNYKFEATLIAQNADTVVLEKDDKSKSLVSIAVKELSQADRDYLKELSEKETNEGTDAAMRTWTTPSGMKFQGAAVDYVRRDVTITRRRNRMYVDDRQYDNLPELYQTLIRLWIAKQEHIELKNKQALNHWLRNQHGKPKTIKCEGVLMSLEDGDLYIVPFQFFDGASLTVLKEGWEAWKTANKDSDQKKDATLRMQAESMTNREDQQQLRRVGQMKFLMEGYEAGLTDLWEVRMSPPNNFVNHPYGNYAHYPYYPYSYSYPITIVVPGRNSQQARVAALRKYPRFAVGSVARINRHRH